MEITFIRDLTAGSQQNNMESIVHPTLGTFVVESIIGTGTFATVCAAHHEKYGFPVAIKVFDVPVDQDTIDMAREEAAIHKHISHPLIAKVYDDFVWNGHLCLLMEKVTGTTLLDYANRVGALCEDEVRHIIGQLVLVLSYLYDEKIVHRDIKCENIIIDYQGFIHVIDFAFAKRASDCTTTPRGTSLFSTSCGSPWYAAPEIFLNQDYGFGVDVWSAGIVMYAMLHGSLPFHSENTNKLVQMVTSEDPSFERGLSSECVDLLKKMLEKNPEQRITISEVKKHTWLSCNDRGEVKVLDGQALMLLRPRYTRHSLNHRAVATMRLDAEEQNKLIDELESGVESKLAMVYKMVDRALCAVDLVMKNPPIFISQVGKAPRVRGALSRDDCLKLCGPGLGPSSLVPPKLVQPKVVCRTPVLGRSPVSMSKDPIRNAVRAKIRVRRHSHCPLEDSTPLM